MESQRLEREALREMRRMDREAKALKRAEASSAASSSSARPAQTEVESAIASGVLAQASLELDAADADSSELFEAQLSENADCFIGLKPCHDGHCLMVTPKPKNSEFDMRQATEADQAGFRASDAAEWKSITDLGAVEIIPPSEARKIREQTPQRILASRVVRRKKPMPGIGSFKYKSRWCVLGHADPDSGSYRTFSPMPCTEAISLFFQLALCLSLRVAFADVRSAFCQSDPLDRPQGDLYAEVCDGLELAMCSLIKLVAPVYGLEDAPLRWHETVVQFLFSLGFERSLFEQCWLIQRKGGRITAMILLEVDDFNVAATPSALAELQQALTERFEFGKWEFDAADFARRTVKFTSDKVIMTQEKYITEKLHQLKVPRGLLAEKDKLISGDLFEEYRSMLYRVSWLAQQTRPEAAGIVSILSSRMNRASIHDVCCLNKLIHHIRSTASQPLILHKFDLDKLILIAASDAGGVAGKPIVESEGLEPEDTVQGAWVILATDHMPSASQKVRTSVLSWRSARLKRRVSSTLAGEALAFNQALSEVEWLQLMIRDVLHGDVHKEDWRKSIVPFMTVLREDCQLKKRLQQCCITDAKSLFDALQKESINSRQDRRTSIEVAIILDAIESSGSVVRWSPHPKMVADVLTKDNIAKSNGALEELLRTGKLAIWDENEELRLRKNNPSFKLRSKKASQRIRTEGSCLLNLANKKFGELLSIYHFDVLDTIG